jgi:hypothetical protein
MSAQKFRKKPIVVEAIQWTGTAAAATPIIDWVLTGNAAARYRSAEPGVDINGASIVIPETIDIDTLEGVMSALPGDWIIRGVVGEFYPCRDDVFQATYEAVSE